jgi:hypothetical protein
VSTSTTRTDQIHPQELFAQKEAARLAREKEEPTKAEKAKASPVGMVRDERVGAWDEDGMPTKEGEDVPKSILKKLWKEWER